MCLRHLLNCGEPGVRIGCLVIGLKIYYWGKLHKIILVCGAVFINVGTYLNKPNPTHSQITVCHELRSLEGQTYMWLCSL